DRVRHIAKVSQAFLMLAEAQGTNPCKHVANIVKSNSCDVLPNRKSKFQAVEQQCVTADCKSSHKVTRSGLVESKATMRAAPSGKELLRDGNVAGWLAVHNSWRTVGRLDAKMR